MEIAEIVGYWKLTQKSSEIKIFGEMYLQLRKDRLVALNFRDESDFR